MDPNIIVMALMDTQYLKLIVCFANRADPDVIAEQLDTIRTIQLILGSRKIQSRHRGTLKRDMRTCTCMVTFFNKTIGLLNPFSDLRFRLLATPRSSHLRVRPFYWAGDSHESWETRQAATLLATGTHLLNFFVVWRRISRSDNPPAYAEFSLASRKY